MCILGFVTSGTAEFKTTETNEYYADYLPKQFSSSPATTLSVNVLLVSMMPRPYLRSSSGTLGHIP